MKIVRFLQIKVPELGEGACRNIHSHWTYDGDRSIGVEQNFIRNHRLKRKGKKYEKQSLICIAASNDGNNFVKLRFWKSWGMS